jgi:HTH-type transcriptional repressor of NAD biosynthesis genes
VNTGDRRPLRIAILGAESTGKTRLAQSLITTLKSKGLEATWIPEALRDWCDAMGRTPRQHEQQAIAQIQAQRVANATTPLVIADTSPLMTAIYSDHLWGDTSLYPYALEQQRDYGLTLLTGLDLQWVPDGIQRDSPSARVEVDARLRDVLQHNTIAHTLVYGSGAERTQSALQAIEHALCFPRSVAVPSSGWHWSCDTCSDADCEHRLFRRLVPDTSVRV